MFTFVPIDPVVGCAYLISTSDGFHVLSDCQNSDLNRAIALHLGDERSQDTSWIMWNPALFDNI